MHYYVYTNLKLVVFFTDLTAVIIMFLISERRNLILTTLVGSFLATGAFGKEANPAGLRKGPSIEEVKTSTRHRQSASKKNKRILQALNVNTADAASLVSFLVPEDSGIATSNIRFVGDSACKAIFMDAQSVISGLTPPFPDMGITLSSGIATTATGPNSAKFLSHEFDLPGDADLDSLLDGSDGTFDACVLEFDFQCAGDGKATFDYVFASEEYEECSENIYDIFGLFLNGNNIATLPGSSTPISVANVNQNVNSEFYISNDVASYYSYTPVGAGYNVQFDGFTKTLQAEGPVSAGINTLKIAIADESDSTGDTYVFIKAGSFQCEAPCDCEAGLGQQCCINVNSKDYNECVYASDLSINPIKKPLSGGTKCCANPSDPTRIVMQSSDFDCP